MTNFLKAFGVALISTFVSDFCALTAANAQTWSDMEVRNIKPGMSYAQVEKTIVDEWPKARIKKRDGRVSAAGQSYAYGLSIEARLRTEKGSDRLKITFLPPNSITADPKSSTAKRIRRSNGFPGTPIERQSFAESLKKKYGEPTYEDENNLKWIFDINQGLLNKKRITQLYEAKQGECNLIDRNRRAAQTRTRKDASANKLFRELNSKLGRCKSEAQQLNTCFSNLTQTLCPFHMNYGWTTRPENKGFILGFGVDLYGIPLDKLENDRLAKLKEELKVRARKVIREGAGSGGQPEL